MDTGEFVSRWTSEVMAGFLMPGELGLVGAPRGLLEVAGFPEGAARFLVEAGLPKSSAPFLSFEDVARGPLTLAAVNGAHQFRPEDLARLAPFYVLGSDGAGNPLCLDISRAGEIVMLDHEDGFVTRTFVASSVETPAEALLLLYTVPRAEFRDRLRACDPRAAADSAFLPAEVAMLGE